MNKKINREDFERKLNTQALNLLGITKKRMGWQLPDASNHTEYRFMRELPPELHDEWACWTATQCDDDTIEMTATWRVSKDVVEQMRDWEPVDEWGSAE